LIIQDAKGQGVSNARVRVTPLGSTVPLLDTFAGTNGYLYLFPHIDGINSSRIQLQLAAPEDAFSSPGTGFSTVLDLGQTNAERTFTFNLDNITSTRPKALDVLFVIDTTGSMGDELRYITTELRDIISTVQAHHPGIAMRFGLIVYRDEGDEYIVKSFDFTNSLNLMQAQLSEQYSNGGGDYPEAMEQALAKAIQAQWRGGNTARLLFLIADAPPHDDQLKATMEQIYSARQMGLRIYAVAASGVGNTAEFMLRNASLLTQGRYLFLTDDSGVGNTHAEPKVPSYIVTSLADTISRVIASELAGQRLEPDKAAILRTVGAYQQGICDDVKVDGQ
jgi:hypothetical protein